MILDFLRNLVVLVATAIIVLVLFIGWCFLVLGVDSTFGVIILVATLFIALAIGRTRYQRNH